MIKRKFFPTYREAKAYLKAIHAQYPHSFGGIKIYDLKKSHPRRIKTRYLVGSYYDWLDI